MSLDQQIALARPARGESTHLSKTARQVVAPFLQKLYEIVNDPRTDELIRWSENGDSFYVLNHERLAREVLGRWFKHEKFTSFVRQLNMYGFHKIPHLQQGVLKSDSDTELWNFEHPHFRRGQPDLLCLIQRKKQSATASTDDADPGEPFNTAASFSNASGQVLDINSIVNGVAAIKRHQQAISTDLNALKSSNDLLWKEASLTRQRYDKHQDTINRILKFLAGVFGHTTEGIHKNDDSRSPSVVPRPRQRLMISDGRSSKGKTVEIADVDDDDNGDAVHTVPPQESTHIPLVGQLSTVESPLLSPAPSVVPSETFAVTDADAASPLTDYSARPPMEPAEVLSRTNAASDHVSAAEVSPRAGPPSTIPRVDTSISPSHPFSLADSSHPDSAWQAAIQQVLSNPVQMQRLMQAIATQQNFSVPPPESTASHDHTSMGQLAPYNSAYDFNRFQSTLPVSSSMPPQSFPVLSAANDMPSLEPFIENASRLEKTRRDTMAIEAEMDTLQSSINMLIRDLGMDPSTLHVPGHDGTAEANQVSDGRIQMDELHSDGIHPSSSILPPLDSQGDSNPDTLFLESWLNGMSSNDPTIDYTDVTDHFDPSARIDGIAVGDASTEQLTAILDEVSETTASPHTHSPELRPVPQKRKSDVAGFSLPNINEVDSVTAPGPKTKRKR
ncbi:uncharacterized protein FIBRA_02011 [Fibroporia radiculosa]|uniref:HSF-type DNA-binding domain-containing protein n=1 Tax=Fibroporia radiculosa TaxID=599839 RepID=J4I8T8_9APHY|nr:uncharacterized protein FIBRA_02011 [Fibroporia radiculosa]CCL99986.1 predicted protein [Fibroporia radiculosa]